MKEGFEGGKAFSVSVNNTTYVGNFTVSASRAESSFTPIVNKPKSVKTHEILHALVAEVVKPGSVSNVTREPGETYSGATFTSSMSIEAASAAYAFNQDGTGHDVNVVHYHGGNLSAAASRARSIVFTHLEEADELGKVFDEKPNMTGGDVRAAMHRGAERRENPEVTVVIFNNTTREKRKVENLRSNRGRVILPGEWMVPSINEEKVGQNMQEAEKVEAEVSIFPLHKKRKENINRVANSHQELQEVA